MTKYYTYKWQVPLLHGQVVKYTKGKGYYAAWPKAGHVVAISVASEVDSGDCS